MSIAITIAIVVIILLLGILGVFRGVRSGLLTLVGTLMAAALVDLWHPTWAEWLVQLLGDDRPHTWTWAVTSLSFLLVALIVGYGSSTFLPRKKNAVQSTSGQQQQKTPFKERLSGGLLGALNGALIASYLLHYTRELLQNKEFETTLQTSLVARVLYDWLPWFVLAMVVAVLINIFRRLIQTALAGRDTQAAPQQAPAQTGGFPAGAGKGGIGAGTSGATGGGPNIAGNKSAEERKKALSEKIDQKLGDNK
jgi:uncharacterized membrane protein required for colicin V production